LDSWYNPASGRYLSHYQGASCNFIEYVTRFEGDVLLTTSNQFNDCMPAAPGNYRQCFSVNEPNELLQHHENSEKYLIEQGHRVLFDSFNFEKELRRLSTLQAEATMAKQLWPLRYAFMYMFRIRPKHGLTVREQALPKS
jgi:hypothetical protein